MFGFPENHPSMWGLKPSMSIAIAYQGYKPCRWESTAGLERLASEFSVIIHGLLATVN